jgi:hypothetical protein
MRQNVHGYAVDEAPLGSDAAAWQMLAESLKLNGIAPASVHAGLRARIEQHAAR